jgi:streptogramin lyase
MNSLRTTKKELMALMLGLSLVTSMGTYTQQAEAQVSFITIPVDQTLNPDDFPFDIECGDPDFVYVTINAQGLLAKINRDGEFIEFIDQPDEVVEAGQDFYSIARDPNTGNLYVNERLNGELWQFNPMSLVWTRIPILEQISNPLVTYDPGYELQPRFSVIVDESAAPGIPPDHSPHLYAFEVLNDGEVQFANGNVWVTLQYLLDFDEFAEAVGVMDVSFAGLAKVNPTTLDVTRIAIPDAIRPTGLAVDATEPNILWVTDFVADKVYRFDTTTESVTETITLDVGSFPRGVDTDSNNVFVALDKFPPGNSEIAQINKSTLDITIIDTGAPIDEDLGGTGTFSVFVNGGLLVWTDRSNHVGTIDLVTSEITVENTSPDSIDRNHFGCVPKDGEFWFASAGSAKVGILPNSKFSGGRPVRATSAGGGGGGLYRGRDFAFGNPDDPRYDSNAPVIEEVLVQGGSLKILAKVTDTVGVEGVQAIIDKKPFSMNRHDGSQSWWYRVFTSDDLPSTGDTLLVKIVAWDYNKNKVEHSMTVDVPFGALSANGGASFAITPLTVGHQPEAAYSITASAERTDTQTINPKIAIKNTSAEPLQNIRIILSPELKGKFLLSEYAIKSIEPQSEYTISLKLNGKPNVDAMNNPIPYSGKVIISVDNKTPYILELSGEVPNESASLQSLFMKMVSSKSDQRYKSFEKPDLRISQDTDYKISLGSGESMVKGSDELIITNTSDKPLKNLRIMTSSISEHIMPDQRNIDLLPAGSFVKVKLVSKLNDAVSDRNLQGEIIVAPENGKPVSVPINIGKQLLKDRNEMYEVSTVSGSDTITHTYDNIVITNKSEESVDNVRVILPQELARVFSLSEDSFKFIEANGERTVQIKLRGTADSSVRQILNQYSGDIIIVSSDGMKKILPVNISWKGISSEHFVINARDNAEELTKAAQVINFLERSYPEVTKMVGNVEAKTALYMTSSLDEVNKLSDALAPSTYVYDDDVGFVWSNSEDVNILALKEFTYRTIIQNYGTYWVKQKISADKGNWLADGISTYVTASIAGERGMIKSNLDAFIAEPVSFEWYAEPTPSQSGASHTLFKLLAEKYGESIMDRTLTQLASTIVSNNKCDTIEQCALLMAVYGANGWSINDKKHELAFATIIEEWNNYVEEKYAINEEKLAINGLYEKPY